MIEKNSPPVEVMLIRVRQEFEKEEEESHGI